MSGHFKDMTFRSPTLETSKTEAGYGYGIPGPIHFRGHFPYRVFCFAHNILNHALPRQAPRCFLCLSLLELSKDIVKHYFWYYRKIDLTWAGSPWSSSSGLSFLTDALGIYTTWNYSVALKQAGTMQILVTVTMQV